MQHNPPRHIRSHCFADRPEDVPAVFVPAVQVQR